MPGVSQSAVSRTFTPGASISSKTRAKVLAAAKELGYRPNAIARSLITNRSRIIAVVMAYLENLFYPDVLEELGRRLAAENYHLLLFTGFKDRDSDPVFDQLMQYRVDGIILASTSLQLRAVRGMHGGRHSGGAVQPHHRARRGLLGHHAQPRRRPAARRVPGRRRPQELRLHLRASRIPRPIATASPASARPGAHGFDEIDVRHGNYSRRCRGGGARTAVAARSGPRRSSSPTTTWRSP